MVSILKEIKNFMKTDDYKWNAGKSYDKKGHVHKETYQEDVEKTENVTVKPPSGYFFGNVDGKTHTGYMKYNDDGYFMGNIDGKTHKGWLPFPKQKVTTKETVERVRVYKTRGKLRNKIIRVALNLCKYFEHRKKLNVFKLGDLHDSIKCFGFNNGVEKFTHKLEINKEKSRMEADQERDFFKLIDQGRRQWEIDERQRQFDRDAEFARKAQIAANKAKKRAEAEAKKKPLTLEFMPGIEEIVKHDKLLEIYPYIGITMSIYDYTDQGAYIGVIRYKGNIRQFVATDQIRLRYEMKKICKQVGRENGFKQNPDEYKKPSTKNKTANIDISHVQRSMGIDGNDDDDMPDIF